MSEAVRAGFDDAFLAQETERSFYDYSFAWEGELEEVRDEGDALVRALAVPWFDLDGIVERLTLDPARVDERIETLLAEVGDRDFWWVVGPSSEPADLTERLVAHGLEVQVNWDCLALSDIAAPFPVNPEVQVEPLSPENAADYAAFCAADVTDPSRRAWIESEKLAAAQRYLEAPMREAHIILGRLDGVIAGCVVLRSDPNGVAYLRNAETRPEFRNRGVYMTLVQHRLAVAREAGCTAAVVQAQVQSSSPILRKRGFRRVSWLRALKKRV